MKKEQKEIPMVFYLYIGKKIFDNFRGSHINYRDVKSYLGEWKIPKKIRPLILKELEILGVIEIDGYKIYTNRVDFCEEKCNKYYEILGIF
ncbi:MAG: hypothetical protein ACOCT9_02345 [archaeon]